MKSDMSDESEGEVAFDFTEYYANFRIRLRQYLRIRGIPEWDLEEVIQEIALASCKFWEIKEKCEVEKIMFGIAKNKVVDYIRYQRRKKEDNAQTVSVDILNDEESPIVLPSDEGILLNQLINKQCLTSEQIEVVILHYIGGFTQKEIALMMAISKDTIKSRLRIAKAKLRESVEKKALPLTNPKLSSVLHKEMPVVLNFI